MTSTPPHYRLMVACPSPQNSSAKVLHDLLMKGSMQKRNESSAMQRHLAVQQRSEIHATQHQTKEQHIVVQQRSEIHATRHQTKEQHIVVPLEQRGRGDLLRIQWAAERHRRKQ